MVLRSYLLRFWGLDINRVEVLGKQDFKKELKHKAGFSSLDHFNNTSTILLQASPLP
jgi:hypothetical protein